jgi:predicted metal-dependent phosphoesterase TrpH
MGVKEVIDFYGKRNFDVIAITDHVLDPISRHFPKFIIASNWIKNQEQFNLYSRVVDEETERAWNEYEMLVIKGVEITNYLYNQHIVAIDVKKFINPSFLTSCTIKKMKRQGCLFFAAHPWRTPFKLGGGSWRSLAIRNLVDAWEIGNGVDFFPHILDRDVPFIANTDFHEKFRESGINGFKTYIYAEKNVESIKQAILDKEIRIPSPSPVPPA